MDKSLRDALAARSKYLGFDSIQAFLRVLAKAVVDERTINFNADPWPEPSPEVAARINKEAKQALEDARAGKLQSFDSVKDFLRDLNG